MRAFVSSVLIVAVLLVSGGIFSLDSAEVIEDLRRDIEGSVMVSVTLEEWDAANSDFDKVRKKWDIYRKKATFFSSTDYLDAVELSMVQADCYLKAEDVSNASGELALLSETLKILRESESPSIENIF